MNLDVVRQGAARSLSEPNAFGILGPALRFPELAVEGGDFVDLHPFHQLVEVLFEPDHGQVGVEGAGSDAAESGEERAHRHVELAERCRDNFFHVGAACRKGNDQARERTHFHGLLLPARCLKERILLGAFECFEGRFGARVFDVGFACPRL